jgi:hypothetical protein
MSIGRARATQLIDYYLLQAFKLLATADLAILRRRALMDAPVFRQIYKSGHGSELLRARSADETYREPNIFT